MLEVVSQKWKIFFKNEFNNVCHFNSALCNQEALNWWLCYRKEELSILLIFHFISVRWEHDIWPAIQVVSHAHDTEH